MNPVYAADFLLDTAVARRLYHEVAADLPVIDYHNHLDPSALAADRRFADPWDAWLRGDHYKWRALRWNGIDERLITGAAPPRAKFDAWCATVPRTLRNPLWHWSHLELKRLGVPELIISPVTAGPCWDLMGAALAQAGGSPRGLIDAARVRVLCTTDDPADDLAAHRALAASEWRVRVLPTWRPDRALGLGTPPAWNAWLDALGAAAGIAIRSLDDLDAALIARRAAFAAVGCRVSDHGLETVPAAEPDQARAAAAFAAARAGRTPDPADHEAFRSWLLDAEARRDHADGWVQQYHIGALRDPSTRLRRLCGADAGADCIGEPGYARPLARLLDRLDRDGRLARTILYNLHPADNAALAVLAGSFQDGSVPGKVQFGAAWWFLDQLDGMGRQLDDLGSFGLLSRFVGMLTDSRSFLSFSRHEYFRRLLCRQLGRDWEAGLIPPDHGQISELVADVCYNNAAAWFESPLNPGRKP
jgi:glucuronate isomerase